MNVIKSAATLVLAVIVVSPALADRNGDRVRQPPDQVIEFGIRDELQSRFRLDHPDVKARVMAGKVTLEGEVSSFNDRMQLEQQIKQIDGVRYVHNRLHVKRFAFDREPLQQRWQDDKLGLADQRNFRGEIQWKGGDEMIVSVFDEGPVEVTLDESTYVTLDGKRVADSMLGQGLLVSIQAKQDRGELVAQAVAAHSPK
ncbi:BON domain-containing protein [Planctomycetes bacterium TBK1r]|uniref:BON domain protein n=1 Tax=Stieleria magnilauensis TaxID=2527963 RepID=A0ABX5XT14_9BACT|nr:BON domain protein [Planctomycetes bacterium TBK1r]